MGADPKEHPQHEQQDRREGDQAQGAHGGVLPVVARDHALLVGDAAGMVSPVTAGGIHTALHHGAGAGEAIARFVRGEAGDPADWFVRRYPRFRLKRALRWGFDHFQSDWLFDRLLGTPAMRRRSWWRCPRTTSRWPRRPRRKPAPRWRIAS